MIRLVSKLFLFGILPLAIALFAADYQRLCQHPSMFRFWDCLAVEAETQDGSQTVPAAAVGAPEPEPVQDLSSPGVPAGALDVDGWMSAGIYDGDRWVSRLLSVPATAKPDDLVGLVVTPTRMLGTYLRAHHPLRPGGRAEEIGEINVGDLVEIGKVHTLPSTQGGVAVWVAVRRVKP